MAGGAPPVGGRRRSNSFPDPQAPRRAGLPSQAGGPGASVPGGAPVGALHTFPPEVFPPPRVNQTPEWESGHMPRGPRQSVPDFSCCAPPGATCWMPTPAAPRPSARTRPGPCCARVGPRRFGRFVPRCWDRRNSKPNPWAVFGPVPRPGRALCVGPGGGLSPASPRPGAPVCARLPLGCARRRPERLPAKALLPQGGPFFLAEPFFSSSIRLRAPPLHRAPTAQLRGSFLGENDRPFYLSRRPFTTRPVLGASPPTRAEKNRGIPRGAGPPRAPGPGPWGPAPRFSRAPPGPPAVLRHPPGPPQRPPCGPVALAPGAALSPVAPLGPVPPSPCAGPEMIYDDDTHATLQSFPLDGQRPSPSKSSRPDGNRPRGPRPTRFQPSRTRASKVVRPGPPAGPKGTPRFGGPQGPPAPKGQGAPPGTGACFLSVHEAPPPARGRPRGYPSAPEPELANHDNSGAGESPPDGDRGPQGNNGNPPLWPRPSSIHDKRTDRGPPPPRPVSPPPKCPGPMVPPPAPKGPAPTVAAPPKCFFPPPKAQAGPPRCPRGPPLSRSSRTPPPHNRPAPTGLAAWPLRPPKGGHRLAHARGGAGWDREQPSPSRTRPRRQTLFSGLEAGGLWGGGPPPPPPPHELVPPPSPRGFETPPPRPTPAPL